MNKHAWVAVIDQQGFTLGFATRGEAGYAPLKERMGFETMKQAQSVANELNQRRGLTLEQAVEIQADSMRLQNIRV